jgi:hypothetical protein
MPQAGHWCVRLGGLFDLLCDDLMLLAPRWRPCTLYPAPCVVVPCTLRRCESATPPRSETPHAQLPHRVHRHLFSGSHSGSHRARRHAARPARDRLRTDGDGVHGWARLRRALQPRRLAGGPAAGKDVGEFVRYVISQLAGALVAALLVYAVLDKTFAPGRGSGITSTSALLIELLFTFALALVVLNSAASAKTHGNSFYGLAVGFTIVVAAFAGGPVSGGAFNPAVGIGPTVINAIFGGGSWRDLWLYIVGPLAGGALAAWVFGLQEREPLQLHAEPARRPESRPA